MEFGKTLVTQLAADAFRLPEEHAFTATVLTGSPSTLAIRTGLSGWGEKNWKGVLYPSRAHSGDFLYYYSRQFSSVELDASFYILTREMAEKWAAVTPETFRFCPKLPRYISHERALQQVEGALEDFIFAAEGFGARLGACWLQLPPTFTPFDRYELRDFILLWKEKKGGELFVEFRNPRWFHHLPVAEETFRLFQQEGVGIVITDTAGRRDLVAQCLTIPKVMLRYAGNPGHPSDSFRLAQWAETLQKWSERGLQESWVFFHQHDGYQQTPELAALFAEKWKNQTGQSLGPSLLTAQTGSQATLF